MKFLFTTLPTPAENLALDEALLLQAEAADSPLEALRIWEPPETMVVIGRASQVEEEVNVDVCRELGIAVFRRVSGGAAIVTGPGCLMYAVVLSFDRRPHLRMIDQAHKFVLGRLAAGLNSVVGQVSRLAGSESQTGNSPELPRVVASGTSDLTLAGRVKFSGNSLRCSRTHLLYHGTLLYDFPLDVIERCLRTPPRQPAYRAGRSHAEFVTNVSISREELIRGIMEAWRAELAADVAGDQPLPRSTQTLVEQLVTRKYHTAEWNFRR